ncbi:MAG: hypothetical protein EOM06_10115 [Sphingobacteriia bacterium]|nr:hypothetical protein [Sphingobacteriia bacterium]
MKKSLSLNILTFEHAAAPVTLSFFKEHNPGHLPLEIAKASDKVKSLLDKPLPERIYTDFENHDQADISLEVDLKENPWFSKHYYHHLLYGYLEKQGVILSTNMVRDIMVWIKNTEFFDKHVVAFDVFGLRVQMMHMTQYPELVIYYSGMSRVLRTSLALHHGHAPEAYTRVLYNKKIMHLDELPEEGKYSYDKVYPVVNRILGSDFEDIPNDPTKNNYIEQNGKITFFIKNVLTREGLSSALPFHSENLVIVPEDYIHRTKSGSNLIRLGLNHKMAVITPKVKLKQFGPFKLPSKEIRFIMIFFEEDKRLANELFMILSGLELSKEGKTRPSRSYDSLYHFIRLKFVLDKSKSVCINQGEQPTDQIQDFLDRTDFNTQKYNYIAIYLSPIKSDDKDAANHQLYYRIKELLLQYHISSQVIYRENLMLPNFRKYYLINIASAILAKAGGIPWRLDCPVANELVVGIGAFRSQKTGVKYVGSTFSFSNNGDFREFDCTSESETRFLAQKIKTIIQDYIQKNERIRRLVIHFYKNMSHKEIAPIQEMLLNLGFPNLPVIILTINKTASNNYIAFDTSWPALMPRSGTIIQIAEKEYLLFNNTRYSENSKFKTESWHLPLKIRFQSTHPELLKDILMVKELLDQVYQFSRMYYKSVKQQNLPVTISYPEMAARIFSWFEGETLCDFGKMNMWFL